MTDSTIEQLSERHIKALRTLNEVTQTVVTVRRARLEEAANLIQEDLDRQYKDTLTALKVAADEACRDYEDALIAQGLQEIATLPRGLMCEWFRSRYKKGKILSGKQGLLEVRTRSTKFPVNTPNWRMPRYGEVFVRLNKKDGTTGVAFQDYTKDWLPEEEDGSKGE